MSDGLGLYRFGALLLILALIGVGLIIYWAYVKSLRSGGLASNPGLSMGRRNLLKGIFAASIVLFVTEVVLPILELMRSGRRVAVGLEGAGEGEEALKIANVEEVPPDSQKPFVMRTNPDGSPGQHPAILIHLPPEKAEELGVEFVAFSAVCTHLGCIVHYQPGDEIFCPCHAGYFDPVTGDAVSGPPKKPLPMVKLRIDEKGDIYAEGWLLGEG